VNPKGKERGNENITLLNISDKAIDLDGWKIEINEKKHQKISDEIIDSGNILILKSNTSLSNSGGSIGLFNWDNILVHKVKYTKKDAAKNGWTTVFQ